MPTQQFESREEWGQRHGHSIVVRNTEVFESGASASLDGFVRKEPSLLLSERLREQLFYWVERRKQEDAEYKEAHAACARQAMLAARYGNLPAPDSSHLSALKAKGEECSARILDLQTQLASTPEAMARMHAERAQQEARQRAYEALDAINNV